MRDPVLPPVFSLRTVSPDEASAAARRHVESADDGEIVLDGLVFWARRDDALEASLLFLPDEPAAPGFACVVEVALSDALASILPPQLPVLVSLENGLSIDGVSLGRTSLHNLTAPTGRRVAQLSIEWPYERADAATPTMGYFLPEAGPAELATSIARQLIYWVCAWQEGDLSRIDKRRRAIERAAGGQ